MPRRARGELERAIMRCLRSDGEPRSIREIQESVGAPVPAYTTVITTIERLIAKDMVERIVDSPRKQRFRTTQSDVEHASAGMLSALEGTSDREAALLKFTGDLEQSDVAFLRDALSRGTGRTRR